MLYLYLKHDVLEELQRLIDQKKIKQIFLLSNNRFSCVLSKIFNIR